jgi:trimeric autotransporter adhesin
LGLIEDRAVGVWGATASPAGWAGYFQGNVDVTGSLTKGGGSFKIDDPIDPANKFLSHSFVESPDMMNIYNGNVTTDGQGYATIALPAWFEALNRDFRYQLTVMDETNSDDFVQAKVIKGVAGNQFTIRTSRPATLVSWQITGVRHDAYAEAHRIPVEEDKPADKRGLYLNPTELGQPESRGIAFQTLGHLSEGGADSRAAIGTPAASKPVSSTHDPARAQVRS